MEEVKTIYFAGGCFWGTERAFQLLEGVVDTQVGYINGQTENPTYRQVCTDTTGFKEAVKISYDPAVLPLERLLQAFLMY
ncbi:peptide-methionine (S)-S-oxide reductase [Facklamia hominis]|nr:peptide-methionine (S)-S-oxide reductase [Facklamia hominis]WPJ90560.1 peptide-methionine (S)-S-oxide reductase [Facklamia hominis]